jgi:predicted negative regulator of RcsB-dependent stress response
MTNPNPQVRTRVDADESVSEWLMLHKREVTWVVVALAILVGSLWFYRRSQSLKAQRAEAAYFQARRAASTGDLPTATSEFRKVATRYTGTLAGTQASLSLAQALYDQKKFKEGVDALKQIEAKAAEEFKPSVHSLEAAGYTELKNFAAAADQYKQAAAATKFPAEKAQYQASAARAYMSAGKAAEAKAIWTELAKDETSPEAAEARVRLGELNAQPMKT